jgi:hypothetical protein
MLGRAFKVVLYILSTGNSSVPEMAPDTVLEHDREIRAVLKDATITFNGASKNARPIKEVATIKLTMLNIFLRRTLLALHRPYYGRGAQELKSLNATSHWSVLECSLALLHSHHRLHEEHESQSFMLWFAGLFQSDFAVAMLMSSQGFAVMTIPIARRIVILQTLVMQRSVRRYWLGKGRGFRGSSACFRSILQSSAGRSFHLFKIFMGVSLSMAALEASESGISIFESMERAGTEVIETVKESRRQRRK